MVNFTITLAVLGMLWFADRRTPQVRSLIAVLFILHSAIAYTAVAVVIFYIFRFITVRKPPKWVSILPVTVNILFTFHIIRMIQDIASFAFYIIFLVFSLYAQRSRLLNFKAAALTDIFEHYQDAIIFADKDFFITDSNRAMSEFFPDYKAIPRKTSLRDFAEYLKGCSIHHSPENLFNVFTLQKLPALEGKFTLQSTLSNRVV
jgi:hypothetical protein